MIPVSRLVVGKGTVSEGLRGGRRHLASTLRPIVFWNITWNCNLKCPHCYIDAGPNPSRSELSTEDKIRIVEQLAEARIPHVVLTGGEPLAARDFWTIAEALHDKGLSMSISSNGTLITRSVAERLASLGFKYAGLSLDSLNPEVHDKFRGLSGAFKMTMRGIENLKDAGIPVGIRMTVTRWNIEEAPGIVDFAYKHGVSRVTYYVLDTIGRGAKIAGDLPTPGQLAKFIDRLVYYSMRYKGRIEILLVRLNQAGIYIALKHSKSKEQMKQMLSIVEGSGGCGRKSISIYPDGSVKPCQFIDYITLGKLPEDKLTSILSPENKKLKPFIEPWNHLTGRKCSKCPYKAHCGGGSRNRALVLKGSFWEDDPLCMLDESYNPAW